MKPKKASLTSLRKDEMTYTKQTIARWQPSYDVWNVQIVTVNLINARVKRQRTCTFISPNIIYLNDC